MIIERIRRSMTKALSWRISSTLTTMTIIYLCTGKAALSAVVGGFDVLIKMPLYFFHERLWNKIYWGKARYKPFVLWFTGLPGSGKSTLANVIASEFRQRNVNFEKLDGDLIRKIFPETGYSKDERNNHIRRVGHLASMLEKKGAIVVSSFISPYKESRGFIRKAANNFVEVYLNTPLEECEKRDPKGHYKKARKGEIKQFTGVSASYEQPENPELVINTTNRSVEECIAEVWEYLKKKRLIC